MPDVFRCLRCEDWCAYLITKYAHTRLRVHWAPGIPRALCLQRAKVFGNTRAHRAAERESMFDVARAWTALSAVIVRLDRTIQYSVIKAMQRISRGVPAAPHAQGMTAAKEALSMRCPDGAGDPPLNLGGSPH